MIRALRKWYWNRRLTATLNPDPKHLERRAASKRGWQTRKVA